ncbi:TetR family transcriptional regulator C-terminal domain-containing protein [Pseudoroseicyclus aestuarii]|uniref:TetR family transcriptional regulator n=1 Tax=Pseudoroseicyclus aestuarii TaxID=1795041 RepID=A0A318SU22_9RHOB|nr:TetR family transcriptional regulator C-terminal domain-containing protein [Pseudoroseicyclus aestuarii]PYE84855.1 TetR family transcriptional regulator [Pseudoroseicyclus aestuarii]
MVNKPAQRPQNEQLHSPKAVTPTRKSFQRLADADRRRALLEATLDCIGEAGASGASARRIAERAGVTAGLIRHHFGSMDEMVRQAYAHLMTQLTSEAAEAARAGGDSPEAALARFVAANVMQPNLSPRKVSLWATFIGRVDGEAGYSVIHRDSYREFLEVLTRLIHPVLVKHGRPSSPEACRSLAIALNGLIDGLWLEGSLDHGLYDPHRLPGIALSAAEGLLRLPDTALLRHLTDLPPQD